MQSSFTIRVRLGVSRLPVGSGLVTSESSNASQRGRAVDQKYNRLCGVSLLECQCYHIQFGASAGGVVASYTNRSVGCNLPWQVTPLFGDEMLPSRARRYASNRRLEQRCQHLKLIDMHVVAAPDFEITCGLYSFELSSSLPALLEAYPVAFTKASDALCALMKHQLEIPSDLLEWCIRSGRRRGTMVQLLNSSPR